MRIKANAWLEWMHHASRASFYLFLYFEAEAAQTSGLVNLVFSRQTGFSSASTGLVTTTDGYK